MRKRKKSMLWWKKKRFMVNYFYKLGHFWQLRVYIRSSPWISSIFITPNWKKCKNQSFLLIYNFHYTRTILLSDQHSFFHDILHQPSIIIKHFQYSTVFLTPLFHFYHLPNRLLFLVINHASLGHPKAFIQPSLYSAKELMWVLGHSL